MHKLLIALVSLLVVANALAPLYIGENVVPDNYIIKFKNAASFTTAVPKLMNKYTLKLEKTFQIGNYSAIHVISSMDTISSLLAEDEIESVEADRIVSLNDITQEDCEEQTDAIWGLARVSSRAKFPPVTTTYQYNKNRAGKGVYSYILDTGILLSHDEFRLPHLRATWGYNFVDQNDKDCNGHGTHVAGTVAGTLYGVAKLAHVIAVKVLNCAGSGTLTGVVSGIEWTVQDCHETHKERKGKCNANMSLGSSKSTNVDAAVKAAVEAGIPFIVAAGNSNDDACLYSPANVPEAISVGATDNRDYRASFSNFGKCVDLLAPGVAVKSAWYTSDTATNTISGTSMASPHVAGVVSLIQSERSLTPKEIEDALQSVGNHQYINMDCRVSSCGQTPNILLYDSCHK